MRSSMLPKYKVRCLIETKELTKRFGKNNEILAVNSLTLQVEAGDIFGFVGPNGAGKTNTVKMLIGLLEPSSGSGRIAGFDNMREVIRIREVTGVLPEPAKYYDNLTARKNLRFYCKLYDIEEKRREESIIELLELFGLEHAIDLLFVIPIVFQKVFHIVFFRICSSNLSSFHTHFQKKAIRSFMWEDWIKISFKRYFLTMKY